MSVPEGSVGWKVFTWKSPMHRVVTAVGAIALRIVHMRNGGPGRARGHLQNEKRRVQKSAQTK
jgi:hypothetical protein